ncbi:MAG: anthranilate synthase component II [Lachnospiraceae bacterium]
MILLIDNYDSFSYNLYQMIGKINDSLQVVRNDEITIEEIEQLNPECIVLSPGPGRPENAGICQEVIEKIGYKIPILGVCLGHQAICNVFGGTISYAKELMHGKVSTIILEEHYMFKGLNKKEEVARYHSLALKKETVPECLKVIGVTEDGEIMAVSHKEYPIVGVQFHPESILTKNGEVMLQNFITHYIK